MQKIASAVARWCALLSLCCFILPATAIYSGTQTVTSTGTPIQLTTSQKSAVLVSIQSNRTNTGQIWVGGSNVSASSGIGVSLNAGDVYWFGSLNTGSKQYDLNTIWLDASANGQKVSFNYWQE